MAISPWILDLIVKFGANRGKVLSAGYPDIVVPPAKIEKLIGPERFAKLKARSDGEEIKDWHKSAKGIERFYEAESVFKVLGYEGLDVLDIKEWRGGEKIADLNYPVPEDWHGKYSLVIDPGTSEHCFHIGQSAINLASMVELNGIIVQVLPLSAWNHGLYSVQPTWFYSFYPEVGFEILWMLAVPMTKPEVNPDMYQCPKHNRFMEAPLNTFIGCVAKRVEMKNVGPVVQFKYKKKIEDATHSNHSA